MINDRFVVTTELDASSFDEAREARALVRKVGAELRQLQRVDPRLTGQRLTRYRTRSRSAEVTLTIRAASARQAADIGISTLRTSIHAAGGSTAGWNGLTADSTHLELIHAA